jgi:KRAB domain-containing zinc finger protein
VGAIDVRLVLEDMLIKNPDLLKPTVTSKTGEKIHECYDCYKKFSHRWQLGQHIEQDHGGERVFRCMEAVGEHGERCNRTYPRKETLENHKKAVHLKEKPFTCEECEKPFPTKYNLEEHKKAVHLKEKPFTCGHCNESFARTYTLQTHIRAVHLKEKPFTCEECEKPFPTKYNLEEHKKAVHRKEKPFRCEDCKQSFSQKGNLKRHIKSVHPEKKGDLQAGHHQTYVTSCMNGKL